MSMSYEEAASAAEDIVASMMVGARKVRAEDVGLDSRAFWQGWLTDDALIVRSTERRTLDYYGGFEYIKTECIMVLGGYVIYSNEDQRVQDCIDAANPEDDDEGGICSACNGSGEGMHDGTTCGTCHGRGELSAGSDEDEDDARAMAAEARAEADRDDALTGDR